MLNPKLITRFSRESETWKDISIRVGGLSRKNRDAVSEHLAMGALIPAGQILRGAGYSGAMLYNSYAIAPDPGETAVDLANRLSCMTASGIGVGVNISCLVDSNEGGSLLEIITTLGRSQHKLWESGIRRTATMAVVEFGTDGIDVIAREIARDATLRHLNIAVNISDATMRAIAEDPTCSPASQLKALTTTALDCGNPGFVFIDRVNLNRPFSDWLYTCNACAEQFLRPDEGVPLASINLAYYAKKNGVDFAGIEEAARLGVRFLNDVIDATAFPSTKAEQMAKHWRPIGLGVMGLDTCLRRLGLPYDNDEAVAISKDLASLIQTAAVEESEILATEQGPLAGPEPSFGRRNIRLLSIAPTGGTSSLWGVSSAIEPLFGALLVKEELTLLIDTGCDSLPLISPDGIDWIWHIKHLAAWQAHVDGGISKTVNLAGTVHAEEAMKLLFEAWGRGVKSVSVFRAGSRDAGVTAI